MIITCPNCSIRFMLDDALMPARGRKVRCAKCSHVWHEQSPTPVAEPETDSADAATAEVTSVALNQPDEEAVQQPEPEPEPAPEPAPEPVSPATHESVASIEATPKKTSRSLVWVLLLLILVAGGIGAFAYLQPEQFNQLVGNTKSAKPAVVKTPDSWKRPQAPASVPEPEQQAEPNSSESLPSIAPDDSIIFNDETESGSAP